MNMQLQSDFLTEASTCYMRLSINIRTCDGGGAINWVLQIENPSFSGTRMANIRVVGMVDLKCMTDGQH